MSAAWIVPAFDELEDGERGFALRLEAMLHEQLALERCVEALAHRIVVAVANGSHRRPYAAFTAALTERNRGVLATLIGVMDDVFGSTPVDRHVKSIEDQFRSQMRGHGPADDPPAEDVENDGQEQEPRQRRDVGDVGDPELIWSGGRKVPVHEIGCGSCITIADGGLETLTATGSLDLPLAHQPGDTLVARVDPFIVKIRLNARTTIRLMRFSPQHFEPIAEQQVGQSPRRRRPRGPRIVPAGRDSKRTAQRGKTIRGLIALHESEDLFGTASVSRANQAAAPSLSIHAATSHSVAVVSSLQLASRRR